jgi:hypothetical protein
MSGSPCPRPSDPLVKPFVQLMPSRQRPPKGGPPVLCFGRNPRGSLHTLCRLQELVAPVATPSRSFSRPRGGSSRLVPTRRGRGDDGSSAGDSARGFGRPLAERTPARSNTGPFTGRAVSRGRVVVAPPSGRSPQGEVLTPSPPAYSTISVTTPAPTVRPPSRIANLSSGSIAIGVISSTSIATLSPGITISTPSGRCAAPVTSVVRK